MADSLVARVRLLKESHDWSKMPPACGALVEYLATASGGLRQMTAALRVIHADPVTRAAFNKFAQDSSIPGYRMDHLLDDLRASVRKLERLAISLEGLIVF